MIFQGSHSVIHAIHEKKRLIDAGEPHDHIRPMLYQGGGLMRGAYGVGVALALEELGYTKVFSYMVGVSSGAAVAAYFSASNTKEGLALLTEDCCDTKFVNPWRFWNQVDTKRFLEVVRNHPEKKIDVAKVLDNPTQMYLGVAEYKTALPKLLAPKSEDHFFNCLHASVNMQNVSPYKVIIDGVHYTDGGFSSPHMIEEAMKELNPTHALIITNNDRDFRPISKIEKIFNRTIYRLRLNGILAQAINTRREARDVAIDKAIKSKNQVAVIWGDGSISGIEKNAEKITSAVEGARTWTHGLFALDK